MGRRAVRPAAGRASAATPMPTIVSLGFEIVDRESADSFVIRVCTASLRPARQDDDLSGASLSKGALSRFSPRPAASPSLRRGR